MARAKKAAKSKKANTIEGRTLEERFDALRARLLAYIEAGPVEAGDVEAARQALLGELKS